MNIINVSIRGRNPKIVKEIIEYFVDKTQEYLDTNNFDRVYTYLILLIDRGTFFSDELNTDIDLYWDDIGLFTEFLIGCDINPLEYLDRIPQYYLYRSKSISEIVVPEGITSIEPNAFNASGVEKITFKGKELKELGSGAFANSYLKEIKVPEGVTYLRRGCFTSCKHLKYVHLPVSLNYIESHVFYGTPDYLEIHYAGTKEQWRKIYKDDGKDFIKYTRKMIYEG